MTAPALAVNTKQGRFYGWPPAPEDMLEEHQYDLLVPSVTNILRVVSKGEALMRWAAKLVGEAALDRAYELPALIERQGYEATRKELSATPFAKRDKAADRGTAVHSLAEVVAHPYQEVDTSELDPEVAQFLPHIQDAFDTLGIEPVYVEATMFNTKLAYAGTVDLICRLRNVTGDQLWIVDHKTSKGVYPEMALQLEAYRQGEFIAQHDPHTAEWWAEDMPLILNCGVLHLRPRGWKLYRMPAGGMTSAAFRAARDLHTWQKDKPSQRLDVLHAGAGVNS